MEKIIRRCFVFCNFIEDKEKLYRLYVQEKLSGPKIAKLENVHVSKIYAAMDKFKIPRRTFHNMNRANMNNNFFKIIDTEEKAYWFGFLTADGSLSKTNVISIVSAKKDEGHLEKFKKSLSANVSINKYKSNSLYGSFDYSKIAIISNQIHDDLLKLGFGKKCDRLNFLCNRLVPSSLKRDFMRGFFDGDGSIYVPFSGKITGCNAKMNGANKEFLVDFRDYLDANIESHSFLNKISCSRGHLYFSIGGTKKVTAFLDFLYEGSSVYLDRKFELYQKIKTSN